MKKIKAWKDNRIPENLSAYSIPGIPQRLNITLSDLSICLTYLCIHYEVPEDDIKSKRKPDEYVFIRHLLFYWIRNQFPHFSLKEIGTVLGNRDHTTVLNSINVFQDKLDTNANTPPKLNGADSKTQDEYLKISKLLRQCL